MVWTIFGIARQINTLEDKNEKKPRKSSENKSKSKTRIKDEKQKRKEQKPKDNLDQEIDFS